MANKIKVVPLEDVERYQRFTDLIIKRYDEKLKELMSEEDYVAWSMSIAKETFFMECTNLPDGDFKDFMLDNFKKIVGDE